MENNYTEVILKAIKFNLYTKVGTFTMDKMVLNDEILQGNICKEITYQFETEILGQENHQKYKVGVKTPLNWWQHFKMDIMPNWFCKIYPVKFKQTERIIEFNHFALMPQLNVDAKNTNITMFTKIPTEDSIYKI